MRRPKLVIATHYLFPNLSSLHLQMTQGVISLWHFTSPTVWSPRSQFWPTMVATFLESNKPYGSHLLDHVLAIFPPSPILKLYNWVHLLSKILLMKPEEQRTKAIIGAKVVELILKSPSEHITPLFALR